MQSIFHFSFNVTDLDVAVEFYSKVLECKQGRKTKTWVDFNFFGHQLSLHLGEPFNVKNTGSVDGVAVPMPHFGSILHMNEWNQLAEKLKKKNIKFIIEPTVRFIGTLGEQSTMFFTDPFGNPIELKGFSDLSRLYDE